MLLANVRSESDVLDRVTVRLVPEDELSRFNSHLQEEHYLESSLLVGEWLRYVAEIDGQWVALLTFSAPALHLKARERWIGWSPRQRARRAPKRDSKPTARRLSGWVKSKPAKSRLRYPLLKTR